jgi:hypothetical protein
MVTLDAVCADSNSKGGEEQEGGVKGRAGEEDILAPKRLAPGRGRAEDSKLKAKACATAGPPVPERRS